MFGSIKNYFSLLSSKVFSRISKHFIYTIRTNNYSFKLFITTRHERYRARTFATKEPDTLSFINYFSSKKDISFIDVGANIGIYSLAFASNSDAPIYSFEFDPSSQVALINNLSLNNFRNITPIQVALGSHKDFSVIQTFYQIFEAGAGAGGLNKLYDSVSSSNACSQTLTPSLSLDYFNSLYPFSSQSVLKIDTDGYELDILSGSVDLLRSGKIIAIILEINSFSYSESDVVGLLTSLDYCLVARSQWSQKLNNGSIYNCVFLKNNTDKATFNHFKNDPCFMT